MLKITRTFRTYSIIYIYRIYVHIINFAENEKKVIAWLKFNQDPFSKVLQSWKETVRVRSIFLKEHTNDKNIEEIIDTWPLYKHSDGYMLVCYNLYNKYVCYANFILTFKKHFRLKLILRLNIQKQLIILLLNGTFFNRRL